MKKELIEKANQYKLSEAASVLSHQLKNPLSAIKGYIEVLLLGDLGELNERQKEYLKGVLENTKQIIALTKNILDVTRIEANQMRLKPQPTDLAKVAEETIKEFSFLAKAKNCQLSFEILEKIPLVNVDSIKIKEVIANFISNAILYNKRKGKVKVSVSKKGNEVILCCKDTGVGIAKEEKNKIFSKFYRSERIITIAPEGSGLGLFISRAIIEKSGGKIWFESKLEEGTNFCFSLPIKR